jgi:hypothetical protein
MGYGGHGWWELRIVGADDIQIFELLDNLEEYL